MTSIDLIIPVYSGASETRECIESVLAAKNTQAFEIIVFNDASPDVEIHAYLQALAKAERITLIINESNLGFVATCNRAMQLHDDRDVVLLNSDTIVCDGWLDRMVACSAAAPSTASVTPFSNNATLCSYPRLAISNKLSPQLPLRDLDAIFASVNAGDSVEIPTGVGFCMLMTRVAIDAVGMFDVDAFGRGYGEENDWCMRATAQGFKHRLCGDTFVYHKGEVSFSTDAADGKQRAQVVIDARYPGYRELISGHLESDSARLFRRRVDLARLAASTRPRVLMLTDNLVGGIARHVKDLASLLSSASEVLILRPHDARTLSLSWANVGEELELFVADRDQPDLLQELLRKIGITRVHLHQVHGLPAWTGDLYRDLNVPLDVTLHDCLGYSNKDLRDRVAAMLNSAERVVAPSQDLARRMREFFPEVAFQVRGHPDCAARMATIPRKVLVLGGLTADKGLKVLEKCALDAQKRKLPLVFKLIGHTSEPVAQFPLIPLIIGGTYREEDLAQLIALERADAFLFPAQVPEGFSYTLTAALRTDLPIVASASGSFPERLAGNPRARTVAWNADAGIWNDALLEIVGDGQQDESVQQDDEASRQLSAAYVCWYLEVLPKHVPPVPRIQNLSVAWVYAPDTIRPQLSLRQLFNMGVECGNAEALTELRIRTCVADVQIASALKEISDASDRIEILHSDLDGLQSRFGEMQSRLETECDAVRNDLMAARITLNTLTSSRSWRITRPLRLVALWARELRNKFAKPANE